MPVIGFQGFTAGSPVALLADQGAVSAGNSVARWGGSLGQIGIEVQTAGTNVAPAAVRLTAVDPVGFTLSSPPTGTAFDPAFHEITYIWTVRDAPLAAFTAPQNMVAGWNDPNTAYGADVAFSFPDPGTYTIDLWCIDRLGTTAIAETTLTVSDPDAVYPGTQTLCLAQDGDFAGKPSGALEFTSATALNAGITSLSSPARILFKRGEDTTLEISSNENLQYIGAWGAGAPPIVRPPTRGRLSRPRLMQQYTVTDITFLGGWDAATETGSPSDNAFFTRDNPASCWFHYHRCRFSGFEIFEPTPGLGAPAGSGVFFTNTVVENWRDYAVFCNSVTQQTFFAIVGCRLSQNVDALNGGTKNGLYNNHGPIRVSNLTNIYIAQTDLFSRTGWSPLTTDTADQPCIRLNSSPKAPGNSAIIERVVCEGGFFQIALEGANVSTEERDANYVLDKVLCISTSKSIQRFLGNRFGGATIRNMLAILPDVPEYHGNSWVGGILLSPDISEPFHQANLDSPVSVHNCSIINLRGSANDDGDVWPVVSSNGNFVNETVENNIAHAPNIDTPVNGDAPLDMAAALVGVTPRYKGVRFNFDHEEGTLGADVQTGASFTLPYPNGTDQSYWQAIEATDRLHMIRNIDDPLLADEGDFTVAFGASDITITNTSGRIWQAGANWRLRLDRKSLIPPMNTDFANPAILPLPRPQPGSPAIGSGDLGLSAYDDFLGQPRPQTGDTRGALLPE